MIVLRPHQKEIISGIQKHWKSGLKNLIVFLATRGGKTYVFTYLSKKANEKGNKVLILTNRKKLFTQTGNALGDFGIHPFYISADTKVIRNDFMTYIAMSQTLQNRMNLPEFQEWFNTIKLIVIDEAHLQEVGNILENPLSKDKHVLGFTGSPMRGGSQRELGEDYQQIVLGAYTVDLEPEYCVPARIFEVPFDMTGVGRDAKGEFNNFETFQRFDSPKIYQGAVNNWLKYAEGKVTLCYCVSILHAAKTCVQFNNSGIPCKFIASKKSKPKLANNPGKASLTKYRIAMEEYEYLQSCQNLTGDVNDIISEWESGKFPVLINVDILTFGYDNNRIDCILVNRATNSIPLWLQIANRGGTPRPGKKSFLLLDMGGNSERLGDYNSRHEWSLFHKKPPKGGGVPATKECFKCKALIHSSARVCDWCGEEQPKSKAQKEIELVERKINDFGLKESIKELKTIEDYELFASVKKYKKMWIFRQIYFSLGETPFKDYMRRKNYHWSYIYRLMDQYEKQKQD